MICTTLPLRTPNPLNGSHGHWARKARIRKTHRDIVRMAIAARGRHPLPVVATITRVAPSRGLDPHDGLGAALKGVIDGIADALGVDDRDPRVRWDLRQRRGPWAVEILIAATETPAEGVLAVGAGAEAPEDEGAPEGRPWPGNRYAKISYLPGKGYKSGIG